MSSLKDQIKILDDVIERLNDVAKATNEASEEACEASNDALRAIECTASIYTGDEEAAAERAKNASDLAEYANEETQIAINNLKLLKQKLLKKETEKELLKKTQL